MARQILVTRSPLAPHCSGAKSSQRRPTVCASWSGCACGAATQLRSPLSFLCT